MLMVNCLICREVQNFNIKINELESTYNRLSFILRKNKIKELNKQKYSKEDRENLLKIKGYNNEIGRTCSYCTKINVNLFKLREEQLNNVIITIMSNYKNKNIGKSELNRAIDILKYKYPVSYHELLKLKRECK